jgi:Ca-activated chloride channel family protein
MDGSAAQAQHEALPEQERQQAMEQWLRQIPDDPGELLRRKFLYEQRKHQETNR